jgi:predicted nucleic acid-binding protein
VSAAVFVDTAYLIALLDPRDSLHARALSLAKKLAGDEAPLLTTDAVLLELANYFSRSPLRAVAIEWIAAIRSGEGWEVLGLDRALLARGEARYRAHADKTWSLTDCVSMEVMAGRKVTDVATTDAGFRQAGFRTLLP